MKSVPYKISGNNKQLSSAPKPCGLSTPPPPERCVDIGHHSYAGTVRLISRISTAPDMAIYPNRQQFTQPNILREDPIRQKEAAA